MRRRSTHYLDAASVEPLDADLAPDDEDFELGPSIGMDRIRRGAHDIRRA